ncbi:MAG: nitroreductase, partial [Thermoleophilia bacterium]
SANGIGFFGAPAVVFICMDRSLSQWSVFDLGMLSQSIMLAATERSIGSAVAYAFVAYPQLIRAELDVPNEFSVVIGIALGHEDAEHVQNRFRAPRRPLTEVVRVAGL